MNPEIRNDVTVTPAYYHPADETADMKVAYTSPQPTVPAMSRSLATMKEMGVDLSKVEVDASLQQYSLELTAEEYVKQYRAVSDYQSLKKLRDQANAEEHVLRQMYAKKAALQDNPLMKEKYPLLIPVFGNDDIFACRSLSPEEKQIPKVFPLEEKRKKEGVPSVVNREGFNTNWRIFSERLLDLIDWNHVFIAGGAVLACMLPPPPKATKNFKCLRKYFHEDAYAGSDIDLFIYGLNEEEGKKKLEEIYEAVCNEIPFPVLAFRSAYAISIVSQFPYRHIQIILRLYSSPAEILMGFDVDSCSMGFDGSQVYMTPRCHQALVRQMNTVDMTRRSPTYEMRLAKYADRGFEVEVPSLNRDRIDPMIFERPWDDVRGLAKLLLLEKLRTPEARYAYRERSTGARSGESWKMQRMMEDPYLKKRLEYSNEKASDYSTVFLPWGPQWTAKKIRKLMMTKDIVLNGDWSEHFTSRGYHTHPCFIGTLEEVEKDCCGQCPPIPKDVDPETLECFVRGPLSFIVDDPGRQTIGSFHPITDGDWSDGAYLSKESEKLAIAANSGDLKTLEELLQGGLSPDTPDALGRTPLHIAVLANQLEVVKFLIDKGADPAVHMKDGRNVIHIACEYGYLDMLALLLEKLRLSKKDSSEGEESTDSLDLDEVNPTTQLAGLHYAILFGHVDCVEYLLNNGAMCDKMIWSSDKNYAVSVMVLAAHTECFSHEVAIDLYKLLHSHGASLKLVDNQFNNVMHMLCSFNYIHFMQYLMENDPVAVSLCSELNNSLQTPLHVAVTNGYYTMARMMIEHGVAISVAEESLHALNAKRKRDKRLNRYGYNDSTLDQIQPLLHLALQPMSEASMAFVEYLLEKGVDVNAVFNNQTALDIALSNRFYLSEEDRLTEENNRQKAAKLLIGYAEKELQKMDAGSYVATAIQQFIQSQRDQIRIPKRSMWLKHQTAEQEEIRRKEYKALDARGAMRWNEIVEIKGPVAKVKGRQRMQLGFYQRDQSGPCGTVRDGKALQGEQRLKALGEEFQRNMETQSRSIVANTNAGMINGYTSFTVYCEASEYGWRSNATATDKEAERYAELFDAVKRGDCATVRRLCTPGKQGMCTHLLVSGYDNLSPLGIAIVQGNREMIALIFEMLLVQYTPIRVNRKVSKSARISNYALVMGEESDDEEAFVDPNSDASLIVNTCDVNVLFTEQCQFDMTGCPSYKSYPSVNRRYYGYQNQNEEEEESKKESCTLLQYLIYRGDASLLEFCMQQLSVLSAGVLKKDVEANRFKDEEKHIEKSVMNVIFTANNEYSYNSKNTNLFFPAVASDNLDVIHILMKYTMLGLEVLREQDVKPKEKKGKVVHDDEISDEEYSDSCDEESDKMEVEDDKEEEEANQKPSEDSEYADSDEEEMRSMQQFRTEGKKAEEARRVNSFFPILLAARMGSIKALRYFMDEKRVSEDLSALETTNPLLFAEIKEAGGIAPVYERVFTMKYHPKEGRLVLEAVALLDSPELFQLVEKELTALAFDVPTLVKSSTTYPSLLEYSVQNKSLAMAAYLLEHFTFREKEILSMYGLLGSKLSEMNTTWELLNTQKRRMTQVRGDWNRRMLDKENLVVLYQNIIHLIDLLPANYRSKAIEKLLQNVQMTQTEVLQEVLEHIPRDLSQLEDYDQIVEKVIEGESADAMRFMIESLGLRAHLMDENTKGYTVVESVMQHYMKNVCTRTAVAPASNENKDEEDKDVKMFIEEEGKTDSTQTPYVQLWKKLTPKPQNVAGMLDVVLKNADGMPRVLTTSEKVQQRVKRDSEAVSNDTISSRRRCLGDRSKSNTYTYRTNRATDGLTNLSTPSEKNVNWIVC